MPTGFRETKMKLLKAITFLTIVSALLSAGCAKSNPQITRSEVNKNNLNSQALRISAPGADAAEPAAASAPDNSVYVVWVEHGADKNADVFFQKLNEQGKAVGEKARVNSEAGAATAWRGDPPTIAVGADGKIFVGWTARVNAPEGSNNDLVVSVSRDGGRSFDAPVKVNDDKLPAVHGMHSLAVDKNGSVYMAWLDDRYLHQDAPKPKPEMPEMSEMSEPPVEPKADSQNGNHAAHQHSEANREVYFAVSKDGGKSFSPNKKLASDVCPCCKTSLIVAPDGEVYTSWRQVLPGNFRHIAVAASIDNGATFGPATIVSDDRWQIAGCPVSGASLAIDANNALNVVWFSAGDAGKTGIYRAESVDGGKTFSPRVLMSEGAAFGTQTLLADEAKNLEAVWSAGGTVITGKLKNAAPISEIGAGELPSAALAGKNIIVAFIHKENDKRAVWISPVRQ